VKPHPSFAAWYAGGQFFSDALPIAERLGPFMCTPRSKSVEFPHFSGLARRGRPNDHHRSHSRIGHCFAARAVISLGSRRALHEASINAGTMCLPTALPRTRSPLRRQVLRTSDLTLTAEDLIAAYKQLIAVDGTSEGVYFGMPQLETSEAVRCNGPQSLSCGDRHRRLRLLTSDKSTPETRGL